MLTLDEAVQRLSTARAVMRRSSSETVSTFDALQRVLAADVLSTLDVPPEDNTSMDGYALRAADVPGAGTVLPVSQRIPAGHVGTPLRPGTAARIFTGAQAAARRRRGGDAGAVRAGRPANDGGLGAVRVNTVPQPGSGYAAAAKTCCATPWCCARRHA